MELTIRLLGPVELWRDGTAVAAGGRRQLAVLAMLALRAGQPVTVDELVDGIWGESDVASGGHSTIWPHISRIRATLRVGGHHPLATVGGGYRLDANSISVDADEFERLLGVGRGKLAGGDPAAASASLGRALALWRGPALMDLREFPFAVGVAARYDDLRVDAAEELNEARLALGESQALLPGLRTLIAENPYRERLRGQLMLALYRAGQQAAALEAYAAARRQLTMDLGVEPGPELARLHQQILEQASELTAPTRGPAGSVPGRPGPARLRQLPGAPVLIGRDEQLRELERLAGNERLITLTGTGGTGKTALAIALMHRLLSRFADGAAFVDLAALRRPEQVIPAISEALHLAPSAGSLSAEIGEYLADRETFLLLDNFEHVLGAAPDLEAIVSATGGLVVVTSRSPLGFRNEHLVAVPPLPIPGTTDSGVRLARQPAVRLFMRAVAASGGVVGSAPAEQAAVRDICRTVGGLPLAIEIAAAQTRAESVEELAAHVRDELPRLRSRARDVPARQQTLEAAIAWSIDLLDAELRPHLYRLTAFTGPFAADGASAVCDLGPDETIQVLASLLDASLLTRQPAALGRARFRLLFPVRAVARSRAEPALLADAAQRHAAFMGREIDRLCPFRTGVQEPTDLEQLRVEHNDVMAMLAHLETADPDSCARAVHQLEDYWQWTGRESIARRVLEGLLEQGGLSDQAACVALAISSWAAFLVGQLDQTRRSIDRASRLMRGVADPGTRALVSLHKARFGMTSGAVRRTRTASYEAVRQAEASGQPRLLATCLGNRALSDPSSRYADTWLDDALRIAREGPMPHTEAWVLGVVGANHGELDPAAAIPPERAALEICRRFQAPESSLTYGLSTNLASHLITAGNTDEARALALTGLRSADRLGHRTWALFDLELLGVIEAAAGHAERAMVLIAASRVHIARIGATSLHLESDMRQLSETVDSIGSELGQARAARARMRGEAMSLREAIAFAFGVGIPHHARRRGRRAVRAATSV